jgi:tetratricopeptide (TPR) repeat protein
MVAAACGALAASCGDEPPAQAPPQPPMNMGNMGMGMGMGMMQQPPPPQPWGTMDPNAAQPGMQQPPPPPQSPILTSPGGAAYQQAMQAFSFGDLANAKRLFQQATQQDPKLHQAFYSLGVVQERLRDAGAAASYRQAFTLVADYEPAIIAYAMLLAKKGNLGEADRVLTEKRGQMPRSAAVAATLAEVKSLQKDTGSAQRIAQEALKLNPDYRPAMVIIARDHYRNRRLDLALYALQAILDGFGPENPPRDRDNAEARLLRGLIWREQGQRAQAMDEFRRALTARPDLVEARVQLATFLLEAGNPDEALPVLEGAVRFDADNLPAHLALGDAYRLLGRYTDAKREFDWVIAREPGLPQVHYDLGLLYLFAPSIPGMSQKQQIAEAINELKKFQEVRRKGEPDDSDELLNRAKLKESEINAALQPGFVVPPSGGATPGATGGATPAPGAAGAPGAGAGAQDAGATGDAG